ncbi:MAG: hypothetical protein KF681_07225 [Bdellovibrionaceae bacterium]|nr:hypothetical protein [Pseudobdellovibrionaceae bacterium]
MADYIDKNIILQAYINIDKDLKKIPPTKRSKIESHLLEFARARTNFFIESDTQVEIEVTSGSIKNKITVYGTLAAIGISNYSSFREGVILIYSDVKRLSELMIGESLYEFGARSVDFLRVEARVGVIGSVHRIVKGLESISLATENSGIRRINRYFEKVNNEIERILTILKTEEDKVFLKKGLLESANTIPRKPRRPQKGNHPLDQITLYEREYRRLFDLLK